MKKHILLFLLIPIYSFAQTTDYSKLNKEELIATINSKDNELKVISSKLDSQIKEKDKLETRQAKLVNGDLAELKKSIKETNAVFLKELFDNKYVNSRYFIETELGSDDISQRIENSNVLIRIIRLDETNKSVFNICDQAIHFNQNYLKLFEIRKMVLHQKYDSLKVNKAIKEIEALPFLQADSKLGITKRKMSNLLKNYLENTCLLKKILEQYKKGDQTSVLLKQKYTELQKNESYKDYPYLVETITKVKNNINDYTGDDLQPCEMISQKEKKDIENNKSSLEKTKTAVEQEVVKEKAN